MSLGRRLLTWLAGLCLGAGILLIVWPADQYLGDGRNSLGAFPLLLIVWVVAWAVVRRRFKENREVRSISGTATLIGALLCVASTMAVGSVGVSPEWAYMKNSLSSIVTEQERFKIDSGRYSTTLPPDVRIGSHTGEPNMQLTPDGFTVSIQSTRTPRLCTVYMGSKPMPPAVEEMTPACTRLPFDFMSFVPGLIAIALGVGATFLTLRRPGTATA